MAEASDNDPTTLYRLFDDESRLLYVGISASRLGAKRFGQHSRSKDWWQEIAYARLEHFESRQIALRKEEEAIGTENPMHNIQSNPNRGKEPHPWVFDQTNATSEPGNGKLDENSQPEKWTFRSIPGGYERTIDLILYPEPDYIACLDEVYFPGIDGEEEIDYYAKYLERRGLLSDAIPIYWFVRSPDQEGFVENGPKVFTPHEHPTDFLQRFTTPRRGGQEIDWFQLPVRGLRFKTFWDALGYLPSPFQPFFPLRSLIRSRWG